MVQVQAAERCLYHIATVALHDISEFRSLEQVFINRHIDRIDIDAQIAKNEEKFKDKIAKSKEKTAQMTQAASMNTRNLKSGDWFKSLYTDEEKEKGREAEKC